MRILYRGNESEKEKIINKLKNGDFEFVLYDEDFLFTSTKDTVDSIIGSHNNEYKIIYIKDVIYIESFAHDIFCHTDTGTYQIKEKLFVLQERFNEFGLIRVNKSQIVHKKRIDKILPSINRKFTLLLSNETKVEVTRSYYNEFKRMIGMR